MPQAFVLMPFAAEFDEIYNLFLADALQEAGFEFFRADDIHSQQNILQDIVQAIASSDLIIADLTGSNPNVYYELGIAHALRKRVILLTQSIADLPFDLRSYRVVSYSTHFAAVRKAKDDVIALARGALDGSVRFGSPIADYLHVSEGGRPGVANRPRPADADGDEPGFLDHMVDMLEGFEQLGEIVKQVGEWTHDITKETESFTEAILLAQAGSGSGAARHGQKLARRHGEQLLRYAESVAQANDRYSSLLSGTKTSLEQVVSAQEPATDEAREQLREFLQVLAQVEKSAIANQQAFSGAADAVDALPKIERHLNRAAQKSGLELRRYSENVEQTIAMVSRARTIGERILRRASQI